MVAVDRCRVCGSEQFEERFREPPHTVRRCRDCGFVWVTPRLEEDELVELYGEGYWSSSSPKTVGYADYRGDAELYLRTFRLRLDRVLRDGPQGGRALDVGCAAGYCLAVLAERGFTVQGVELSPVIAAEAQRRVGAERVYVGTLETAPLEPASFDLICLWDVVEHVVDPHALLRRARELLAPGGLLVLETQNVESRFARALGPRWHHYKHAEHLSHFTPATVTRILADTGFAVRDITARHAGKYISADFIAERSARLHPALSRALTPVARLARGRAVYVNLFDEMVVRAEGR